MDQQLLQSDSPQHINYKYTLNHICRILCLDKQKTWYMRIRVTRLITSSNKLINHFGYRTIVVNALVNQLENSNKQPEQAFFVFSSLKKHVQAFHYLGFIADLQSTTLLKKAKKRFHAISFWNGPSNVSLVFKQNRHLSCRLSAVERASSSGLGQSQQRKPFKKHNT